MIASTSCTRCNIASALTIDPSSKPARDGLAQANHPKF